MAVLGLLRFASILTAAEIPVAMSAVLSVTMAVGALALGEAQLQSLIFLKLVVAGHLTLFVARSLRPFLSKPYPAATEL